MLDRLHAHLAMLRREGGIADWYDREIPAGGSIDREITTQLDSSQLFLALVSPDFLNSRYCYDNEMTRAIQKHETGRIVIVPIILEPSDWLSSPLNQFKALPRDGKPISEWTNENAAMLDVVTELRRLVQSMLPTNTNRSATEQPSLTQHSAQVSSKYRVKKSFDQIDREDFRNVAYETIRSYFENSVRELDGVEGLRARYRSLGPAAFTCTVLNQLIKTGRGGDAHITVRAARRTGFGDIYYSFAPDATENTANGGFSTESDDYHLFLRPDSFTGVHQNRTWQPNEVASRLWQDFLQQAGITYD